MSSDGAQRAAEAAQDLYALAPADFTCERDRLVRERTALINQLRALLLERDLVVPQGQRKLKLFLRRRPRT